MYTHAPSGQGYVRFLRENGRDLSISDALFAFTDAIAVAGQVL
jgi:hypothetical protein